MKWMCDECPNGKPCILEVIDYNDKPMDCPYGLTCNWIEYTEDTECNKLV